ncbi:16S rRNA (uracil(1498)-N(3))-methyltransferase [Gryllotalpicola protaetiae]|uniref:Ribosomal RNA small subunit methyltransferase E n=1 Tax=Gryllotalpicola protaetiae TaxID=2419771 RepID=A0A387BVE5_9MICO|nr:16S rRNA (uracil(1498)-N(3))-methyltransferase [Gryllotalpicola protaetiae]AYG05090.1 16S rRNA (uracil(1498)-N(3))-methyltransferase [Gryllotalpicola protaetiae]
MANFYLLEELADAPVGGLVEVTGAEAKHIAAVARTRAGERLLVGNGRGLVIEGTAEQVTPAAVSVRVEQVRRADAASPRVLLAQALAKGDRDELAVQAATELGVDGVIPWQAERSVSRWSGPKLEKGRDRWAAIVREAAKQSMRPWLPEVAALASTKDLVGLAATHRVLVLEPSARHPLASVVPDARELVLVVGPEGGIAPAELAALETAGAESVRLGDTVLRTSTAGPAAIAVLNAALGRW